jgi:hypothetical protein
MRKLLKTVGLMSVLLLAFFAQGCIQAPFMPPMGAVFSQVKAPLDIEYNSAQLAGAKQGQASSISILGLIAIGDCSTQAAAQAGGITTVNAADYDYFNVLGIYQRATVIVHGQ